MTEKLPNESLTESTRDGANSPLGDLLNSDNLKGIVKDFNNKQSKEMTGEAMPDSEIDDGGWLCL